MEKNKKLEIISNRLIEFGFEKQPFQKAKFEDFKTENESEFISSLIEMLGNEEDAIEMSKEHKRMVYDFLPDTTFFSDEFDIQIFIEKNIIKITQRLNVKADENNINAKAVDVFKKSGFLDSDFANSLKEDYGDFEVEYILPFKECSVDYFYYLLIGKGFDIKAITLSGDN